MARIQPVEIEHTDGKTKRMLENVSKSLGMVPNLMRTLAHSPAALEAYFAFGKALGGGSLSARLREQIALVPQHPVLFAGSIADNIRYGRLDASMNRVAVLLGQAPGELDDELKELRRVPAAPENETTSRRGRSSFSRARCRSMPLSQVAAL